VLVRRAPSWGMKTVLAVVPDAVPDAVDLGASSPSPQRMVNEIRQIV
jgi:hypothetical protein